MACPGEGILTCLCERLLNKTTKEIKYFCDFEEHFNNFVDENDSLVEKLGQVKKDIDDAKNIRNEDQVEDVVRNWMVKADNLIQGNTKIRETRSCGCRPCWKYRQGKILAKRIEVITKHIQKCNFERVALPAKLLDMKCHAPTFFIEFESRKTKLNQLTKALEDGNHYMIGLQGMGGTGKTTLAKQVGSELEKSKAFEKVIFVVVSNPPDVSKVRGDIARQLGWKLDGKTEEEHTENLLSRILKYEKKLLIILDDIWKELDLKEIGIPFGESHKNCYVLITSRRSDVCEAMRCQPIIHLHTLGDEEALELFMFHATCVDDNSSSNKLEGLAREFLKECGGLPIAIAALASTLRINWPVDEWSAVLSTLQSSKPFVNVDKGLVKVYNCLKLSYDNLNDKKAQDLLLLCSIFPEDYEIPINLIIRLNIGLGIFGEFDEYCAARSHALQMKNKLIASSLLLKVDEKGCVKMHDLVREAAQWIEEVNIQVIMDSRMTLKVNKRFVFWRAYNFPDQCDATEELEVLLLWISGNFLDKDQNTFFIQMLRLKVLFLHSECDRKVPSPSLLQSLYSLKNIHTLILDGWEIGDISILKNLQSLVTLELKNCLIVELPRDIMQLKKLRWLGLRECEIQKNNPFEVIERCSQLEEFYFVGNHDVEHWKGEDDKEIKDEIAPDISPPTLQMFSIACDGFVDDDDDDNGLRKCFSSKNIEHLISEAMLKHLVGRSEILELGKIGQRGWKSLVPDIVPVENEGMNNLLKLYLYEWAEIEYLSNSHHYSNFRAFSNVVELHMFDVGVKKLYSGTLPSEFLKQLQVLKLKSCQELQNIFLDENFKLPNLRVLKVTKCPMFGQSIFQPSVARSLVRLEELQIESCKNLKSLIAHESLEKEIVVVDSQKNCGSLFPYLKSLKITQCSKLEIVSSLLLAGDLPKLKKLCISHCDELKYLFGEYRDVGQVLQQEIMLPLLTDVHIFGVPNFIGIFEKCKICMPTPAQVLKEASLENSKSSSRAFSWPLRCCFTAPTPPQLFNALQEHNTVSQEKCASSKRIVETFCTAECLMAQPLNIQNIREMSLYGCSKLKSLFSVSMATAIKVEKLDILRCGKLKNIIAKEVDDDDHLINSTPIFPYLQELCVRTCNKLTLIFPSTFGSEGLQKLKSIHISNVDELMYVFGRYDDEECVSDENENIEPQIHLLSLEKLFIHDAPSMINIVGSKSSQLECPSIQAPKLEDVNFYKCNKLEVIFPLSSISSLQNLKCLTIAEAAELKYVFGKHEYGECLSNENESDDDDLHFHFPALEILHFSNVPKMNICAKKCHLSFPPLQHITLGPNLLQEFIMGRTFPDLMAHLQVKVEAPKDVMRIMKDVKKLTYVEVKDLKIEEFLNLEGVEIEDSVVMKLSLRTMRLENLSELRHVWKGPKYILSLPNLQWLTIKACKKLRAIFSVTIVKSLPQLSLLRIEECDELVDIIGESDEDHSNQLRFPKLERIYVRRCNSLKYLFSISTCSMFPNLWKLEIEEAPEMEQVFIHKKDDVLNMTTTFPQLRDRVRLVKLPMLIAFCDGIDFDTRAHNWKVDDCPKFKGAKHIQNGDSENSTATTNVLTNFTESTDMERIRGIEEAIQYSKEVDASRLPTTTSTDFEVPSIKETEEDNATDEAIIAIQSVSSSIIPQSIDGILKERAIEEGATSEDVVAATMVADLVPRNSWSNGMERTRGIDDEGIQYRKEVPASTLPATNSTDFESKKDIDAKDLAPSLLEKQQLEGSTPKSQLRSTSLHNYEEQEKGCGCEVPEPASKFLAPASSSFQNMEETLIETQAKDPTPASETSVAKSQLRGTSLTNFTSSIVSQVEGMRSHPSTLNNIPEESATAQIQEECLVERKTSEASHKTNSIDAILKKRAVEEGPTSEDVVAATMVADLLPRNSWVAKEEATIIIQSTDLSESRKEETRVSSIVNIAQKTKSIKDPMQQNYPEEDHMSTTIQSSNSDSRKQSTPTKKTRDHSSSSQEGAQPTKVTLPQFIPPLRCGETQIVDTAGTTSSHKLDVCEIFQLVELKDGELALLAQALQQYPQLSQPHQHRSQRMIAWSYRVLVDILVVLATKTPYSITSSEKLTLEANLCDATLLGFDREWVDSVRARVFGADMSDVILEAAKDEIQVKEAELETYDIALEKVRKQRVEARERLAVAQRQLEITQNEFEAIDSQLLGLLEGRRKLVSEITKFREIISAKDRPFGI